MKFVYPAFLFALIALAIPIIIHLFNFRKFKKVAFSNVAFLKEIKQESKSKSRLKEWLILLSRLLAITFLVFAFAQPYIPVSSTQKLGGEKAVSIYLDNSFSMDATGENGRLLDIAKQFVYKIIDSYPAGQKFQLITTDLSGSSQRSATKEHIEEELATLTNSANSLSIREAMSIQKNWLYEKGIEQKELFVISDFQGATSESILSEVDSNVDFKLLQLAPLSNSNLFIDSVWIETPAIRLNEEVELMYRVNNTADQDIKESKIVLTINDENFGNASLDLHANSSTEYSFAFTPTETGFFRGSIQVEDYPIAYDNSWNFAYTIAPKIDIKIINEKDSSRALSKLFSTDQFRMKQVSANQVNFSKLKSSDLIVLNNVEQISLGLSSELKSFIEEGGVVCVLPNLARINELSSFFETLKIGSTVIIDTANRRSNTIAYNDPFFSDVFKSREQRIDLPEAYNSIRWKPNVLGNHVELIGLENGVPLLQKTTLGNGFVFCWSTNMSAENANLTDHSIFLLSMYKIALSKASNKTLSHSIQPNLQFWTDYAGETEFLKMKGPQGVFIPEFRSSLSNLTIWPHENVNQAGFYELNLKDSLIDLFAVNYSRKESEQNFIGEEELSTLAAENGSVYLLSNDFERFDYSLESLSKGITYWKWMVALALLMFLIEILLIKFWRN